jgi:hypothetical protein
VGASSFLLIKIFQETWIAGVKGAFLRDFPGSWSFGASGPQRRRPMPPDVPFLLAVDNPPVDVLTKPIV